MTTFDLKVEFGTKKMSFETKLVTVCLSLWLTVVTGHEIRIKIEENLSPVGGGCNQTKAALVVSFDLSSFFFVR